MSLVPIEVDCYAGGRADERPRRVVIGSREHRCVKLLAETVEEVAGSGGWRRRFRVLTEDGLVLKICRDPDGAWLLEP